MKPGSLGLMQRCSRLQHGFYVFMAPRERTLPLTHVSNSPHHGGPSSSGFSVSYRFRQLPSKQAGEQKVLKRFQNILPFPWSLCAYLIPYIYNHLQLNHDVISYALWADFCDSQFPNIFVKVVHELNFCQLKPPALFCPCSVWRLRAHKKF